MLTQVSMLWKPQLFNSLPDAMEIRLWLQWQKSNLAFGSIKLLGGNLTDSNLRVSYLLLVPYNCMSGEHIIKRVCGKLLYSPVLQLLILQTLVGWQIKSNPTASHTTSRHISCSWKGFELVWLQLLLCGHCLQYVLKCNMSCNIHCMNLLNKTIQDIMDGDDDDTEDEDDDE